MALQIKARVYDGRKALGFRLWDSVLDENYVKTDSEVIDLVKRGALDGIAVVGGRLVSDGVALSNLPKEDKLGRVKIPKTPQNNGVKKKRYEDLSMEERYQRITSAFVDDGSVEYGLHTCLNLIKLYKSNRLELKYHEKFDIINKLDVILEDTETGLYYAFRIGVSDATPSKNEEWRLSILQIKPYDVKKNIKKKDLNNKHFGHVVNEKGYYINEEGKRVFVVRNEESMEEDDKKLTSKEIMRLQIKKGEKKVLFEDKLGEITIVNGYRTDTRLKAINKVAKYMIMVSQMVEQGNL